jgi:nicotinamidase-related amidase
MPLTTFDPVTALIVVDLQKGIVTLPTVHPIDDVIRNASDLARAFREQGLPVVLVNAAGAAPGRADQVRVMADRPADWAELISQLGQQPGDHLITKFTWGAFTGSGLEELLKGLGVTQVVVAGVATSIGVESTARQAHELGFNVTVAVDSLTDLDAEAHRNSVERIFPRLAESGTTSQIIELLKTSRTNLPVRSRRIKDDFER